MIFKSTNLVIRIKDSGKGFASEREHKKPGLGLIAMRERAEILSGRLDVTSTPSGGTLVTLTVPLVQDEGNAQQSNQYLGEALSASHDR
jgi:signal transduction histidine kinase